MERNPYPVSAVTAPLPALTTTLLVNILSNIKAAKGAIKAPRNPPSTFLLFHVLMIQLLHQLIYLTNFFIQNR